MGEIVDTDDITRSGEDAELPAEENLGDLLAEMGSSGGESLDSVEAVREIRERY